jgi:(1->4)-alpha-D-glucan 1-alpha-D-glucosylmutase
VPDFAALREMVRRDLPALAEWRSGAVKLAMIARVLHHRREMPALFATGQYIPVQVEGPRAGHVVAFLRSDGRNRMLAAAVRLPGALIDGAAVPVIPPATWQGTRLVLPAGTHGRELLTGRELHQTVAATALFTDLPVALVALA